MNIYDYVLGHQYIYPNNHCYVSRIISISHRKCFACNCENRATQLHDYCSMENLHLDLLVTCRQTYTEACRVFWTTNNFCFQDRDIVSNFYRSLTPPQRNSIRKIRLYIENFLGTSHVGWESAISNQIWYSLSGLQKLEMVIGYYHSTCLPENGKRHRESHLSEFILKLAALNIRSVIVRIDKATWDRSTFNETHDLNGEISTEVCAKRIEKMLLDKNYAHDQCAKQRSLDETWARTQQDIIGVPRFQRSLSSNPYR